MLKGIADPMEEPIDTNRGGRGFRPAALSDGHRHSHNCRMYRFAIMTCTESHTKAHSHG
jgi:hypothetical protein